MDAAEALRRLEELRREQAAQAAADEEEVRKTLEEREAREREAARLRAAEDERLAAVEAAGAARRLAARAQERRLKRQAGVVDTGPPPFLREMLDDEVVDFVDCCVTWLANKHKRRYEGAQKVFGGEAGVRRLVEDIVFALSKNKVNYEGKVQLTYKLFVNGDPQRGKSNVEAVMVRIVHFINNSPLVKDRCYSLLGSVMIGWAESLFDNTRDLSADLQVFVKEAREKEGRKPAADTTEDAEDSSDSDDEPPEEDENLEEAQGATDEGGVSGDMRAELVLGYKKTPTDKQAQLETALAGGVLVFPRNKCALQIVNDLVQAVWHDAQAQPEATRIVPVHFVFLDEADQMRGSTAEHCSETGPSGRELYQYEKQLQQLFGRTRCNGDAVELLVPALVVDVSATNQLSFLDLILRLHDPSRKLLDVLSFTEDPEGYAGLDKCVAYQDIVLADKQLVPLRKHVDDDDVVNWYKDVITKPHACGLVVASNRVKAHNNMDDHFSEASEQAVKALAAEGSDTSHIGVIVHGGERIYGGCMGIYLCGSGRERMLFNINKELRALPDKPPSLKFPAKVPGEPQYAELCASDLRPLLEKLDRESYERGQQPGRERYTPQLWQTEEQQKKNKHKQRKLSCVQLKLLLTLLRRLFPRTPVFIVGHGMVRRSLSLVGVDYLQGDTKTTTLVVTHMLIWATQAANGAGVVQQGGRCCTTLVDFRDRKGNEMFQTVQLLAPQLVWDYIKGGLAFNCWFGRAAPGETASQARDNIVRKIAAAEVCWKQNGGNSVGFVEAVAAHLDMPDLVKCGLAARGAVPPNAADHIKKFRNHMATLQLRSSRFGVIEVRPNLTPLSAETELRLLFRTVGFLGDGPPTADEWLLGELPFTSREQHNLAKHGAALDVARVVNAFLAASKEDDWEVVHEFCIGAFNLSCAEAQPQEGGFTVADTRELARCLERRLAGANSDEELPQAADELVE
jgi:hypothetical protein